eukprot:GEMP01052612.1.p1 GENE.GEMP01052612.1~~GEMP01052612.1.p1  ORF type:complete len:214 (+),score=38.10 GEMP01052612.1:194-835(+)
MNKAGSYKPFFERVKRIVDSRAKYPAFNKHFLHVSKEPSKPKPIQDQRRVGVHIDLAREMNIRKGDLVQVLHGRDQGNQGVIRHIMKKKNQVIVTGMNMKKTFWSPKAEGPSLTTIEMPIHVTNVALIDPVIKKPTRVKRRYTMNGEGVRISKLSGCAMPEPSVVTDHANDVAWKLRQNVMKIDKAYRGPLKDEVKDKRHWQMLQRVAASGSA